jgi:DNA-directed RNA polymerase subunit RPC12/RpoP
MSDDTVQVWANCPTCHSRIIWADDVTDETMLVCKECGQEVGTYGDFKMKAMDAVRERVETIIKDSPERS